MCSLWAFFWQFIEGYTTHPNGQWMFRTKIWEFSISSPSLQPFTFFDSTQGTLQVFLEPFGGACGCSLFEFSLIAM
jgi:hypothetical protein